MKRLTIILLLSITFAFHAQAAEDASNGEHFTSYTSVLDNESLKRGAKTFATRCLSCHSAKFMRFKRIADDLGFDEKQLYEQLIKYSKHKDGDWYNYVDSPLAPEIAIKIFGVVPPDLSLIARSRGTDYLLSYLLNYYQDSSAITLANNTLLPNTIMPNVLGDLQGMRQPIVDEHNRIVSYKIVEPGKLSKKEFYNTAADLVNFLDYVGEPAKATRLRTGWWVILFTLFLAVFAYFLKREYWKDITPAPKKQH